MEIYLATRTGLVTAVQNGAHWQVEERGLGGQELTSVIAREGVILAGTRDGIFCSEDRGFTWSEKSKGLTERYVRWLAYHPDISDFEFAGTEPAGIFVSRDGGESWRECVEVSDLRREHQWWLPYSPGAGCVRGFAFHGQRAYAAVEVGAALRSDDGGESWGLVAGANGRPVFATPPAPILFMLMFTLWKFILHRLIWFLRPQVAVFISRVMVGKRGDRLMTAIMCEPCGWISMMPII